MSKGLVLVYTGNGKGKTTASLGLGFRAAGQGFNVFMIQFMKGQGKTGELNSVEKFNNFTIEQAGRPNFVNQVAPDPMDVNAAREGFKRATEKAMSGEIDVLIMDEINVAMNYDLVDIEDVLHFLKTKPEKLHIVMTGRGFPEELIDYVDMVSEVKEIKHHYNNGVPATKGIEF
ncbi:cob(I)yrinic acid a,c-diamide adenosyltransferase [Clostridium sp. 'deep sea']|uniref:cob(I)yrinic acid a,c-diamide adenosyltransferase n=1 Tax=Clostridium sp. 'deep sea' TaxID=2779445 RepID=UPI0018965BBE|nr:cob(I)yrinic acid a,c-diamide adenosyltransferase [Clostridium sp. 'deep sea']QOR35901.1 cob(I)yrinic acid a,c-diamide adenosyltransferase [Clostridium sp. 'deep sea']